jgi:3'-phosphoadenosine 5'-phosphosulfate sulfotransferase (PAPS reductase)/FAD synthetase
MNDEQLADYIDGRTVIASISGGKDSAAMALWLRERGVPFKPVFLDTGWESKRTYEYLRGRLTDHLGPIHETRLKVDLDGEKLEQAQHFEERLGHYSAMVRLIIHKGMFPSRQRRFCTQELKVHTMKAYLDTLDDEAINAVGIRNDESARRADMGTWEWNNTYDCEIWRPIRAFTVQDVIDIHHRHSLLPNPHYLKGSTRVGCWPCIHARKGELAALGRTDPERVALLADLEQLVGDLAEQRAKAKGTTLAAKGHHRPSWFQSRDDDRKWVLCEACIGSGKQAGEGEAAGGLFAVPALEDCEACKGKGKTRTKGTRGTMWPIRKAVAYGMGPEQDGLFAASPRDHGCMRWGLCEHEEVQHETT